MLKKTSWLNDDLINMENKMQLEKINNALQCVGLVLVVQTDPAGEKLTQIFVMKHSTYLARVYGKEIPGTKFNSLLEAINTGKPFRSDTKSTLYLPGQTAKTVNLHEWIIVQQEKLGRQFRFYDPITKTIDHTRSVFLNADDICAHNYEILTSEGIE
jgi:hypothetical protein